MTIDKFPGKVTQNNVDSSSSRKRWASGKKKKTKILEFIQLRSCRAFFAIPNEGFWTLPPSSPSVEWIDPSWRSISLVAFFCGPAEQTLARRLRREIHGYTTNGFEHIWVTNAIPTYRLVTNLGLDFLLAFSWNSSSKRANIIQFKSPFSSPTSIFLLLRKPLFQELTLTRMGLSWNVEMQGPGCVFQSHLGRAVTEESYKGI